MKYINFTCKEKLQSLLDKSCSQTLRKAWEICPEGRGDLCSEPPSGSILCKECGYHTSKVSLSKPAKFKVGDKVSIQVTL